MWISTKNREFLNMEKFDAVKIEKDTVVGVCGTAKIVVHKCDSEDEAGVLYKEIVERTSRGMQSIDAAGVLNVIKGDRARSAAAQEEARKRELESMKRAEAKMVKPITDKKE